MYRRNECLLFPVSGNRRIKFRNNRYRYRYTGGENAKQTERENAGRAEREEQRPFKPRKVHLWLHRKSQVAAIFYHGILVFTNGLRPRILHS